MNNSDLPTPRRLVLVRHGETASNAAGRFLGRSDDPITEAAERMANAIGPLLPSTDLLAASPARRALQTANAFGLGSPSVDDAFREIDFGDWEGRTQSEVASIDPVGHAAFDGGEIIGFPGGETVTDARDRLVGAIAQVEVEHMIVVTHATSIRILVSALLGLPVARYRTNLSRPANLSVTELAREGDSWRLVSFGATLEAM